MNKLGLLAWILGTLDANFWNAPSSVPPLSAGVEGAPAVVAKDAKKSPALAALRDEPRINQACDDVRAVIVSELADGAASMATLRVGKEPRSWTGRIGDELDGARLMRIGSSASTGQPRVWIQRRGAVCQASLDPLGTATQPASDASRPPARNLRSMVGPVRVVPVLRGGEVAAIRVQGVRRGSLLALLGIEDGDLIESIDGRNPPTPAHVLEAYGRIVTRSAHGLAIGVRRRGAVITIRYRFS